MAFLIKKKEKIKLKKDFSCVFKQGEKFKLKFYACAFLENELGFDRIGIVTGKKIGNAIKRNYEKRLLREFFRNENQGSNNGFDMIFIVEKNNASFLDKREVFRSIVENIKNNDKK